MTTREELDTAGRLARGDMDMGRRDMAVMRYVKALTKRSDTNRFGLPRTDRWTTEGIRHIREPEHGEGTVDITWSTPWNPPRWTVTPQGEEPQDFTAPFPAALLAVTGRNVMRPISTYRITVREQGKKPDTEPYEVDGLEEAVDALFEEIALTEDGHAPHHKGVTIRSDVISIIGSNGRYTTAAMTYTGEVYLHQIEKV